ncbi:MAG: hypothetical protein JWM91_2883 [Rhodospirillales bacterium]|nr:hypothetical protein [Rhodospirillales bacterium]
MGKGLFWRDWTLRAAKIKSGEIAYPPLVCKKCHGEWMGAIEAKAEKAATPLILGESTTLTPDTQTALAQWIMLKVMAGEQGQTDEAVIPQHDRSAFRLEGTIPPYVTIWITRCLSTKWRNAYAKPSALLSSAAEPAPEGGCKNAQTVAFGIGELFAYTVICRAENINLNNFIMFEDPIVRLWPLPGNDLAWPTNATIEDKEADAIATALETLVRHPSVHLRART